MVAEYTASFTVEAVEIATVRQRGGGTGQGIITPVDGAAFIVPYTFMRDFRPQAGGYYIVGAEGDLSYLPADLFEERFTIVEPEEEE